MNNQTLHETNLVPLTLQGDHEEEQAAEAMLAALAGEFEDQSLTGEHHGLN